MVDAKWLRIVFMKKIALIVLLVIALGGSSIYYLFLDRPSITISEDKSFFSDYYVEGNIVIIKCYVTIKNSYHHGVKYGLVAKSQIDYERGLLLEPTLFAKDNNGDSLQYTIPQNSEDSFYVLFSGKYGGTNEKNDRLLPDIDIIVMGTSETEDGYGTGDGSKPLKKSEKQ